MPTTWTPVGKSDNSASEQFLLIEDTYNLSIGDGFSLLIQESTSGISWTPVTKASAPTWTPVTKS